jgi:hypothetical protein
LHPTPRDVFERATASPPSDAASRNARSRTTPGLEMVASRGTVASSPHELASRHCRQPGDADASEADTVEYAAPAETAGTIRSARSHRAFFPSADHVRGFPARLRSNPSVRIMRSRAVSGSIFLVILFAIQCIQVPHAQAGPGPCTTATPTTPEVAVYVSDLHRSMVGTATQLDLKHRTRALSDDPTVLRQK